MSSSRRFLFSRPKDLRQTSKLPLKQHFYKPRSTADETSQSTAGQPKANAGQPEANAELPQTEQQCKSPIWSKSVQDFEKEHSELYHVIEKQIVAILEIKSDNWDTWLNSRPEEKNSEMLRILKSYLPHLGTVRNVAIEVSRLDPHGIAPYITAGAFAVVELCFQSVDPKLRDKAMETMLKTCIVISKWTSYEADLKPTLRSQHVAGLRSNLSKLYLDSLVLIASIYKSGLTGVRRMKVKWLQEADKWATESGKLEQQNEKCSELKNRVESEVKRLNEDIETLDWVRNTGNDPEPDHMTVKSRTGVDGSSLRTGRWLLETSEFKSWVKEIHQNNAEKPFLWLRGPMGTGKTTLICRAISHFEELPIKEVRIVPYYCYGSSTVDSLGAPGYEIILRKLCYRLAWDQGKGVVAKLAKDLHNSAKQTQDNSPSLEMWKGLLRDLIASTSTRIVFVIDALDECKGPGDYHDLLGFFKELMEKFGHLYCLVSSRPHVQVTDYFRDSAQILDVVKSQPEEEMRCFIKDQIALKRRDTRWEKSIFFEDDRGYLSEQLNSALLKTAEGMFRWVEIWLGVFFPKNAKPVRRHVYAEELLKELENLQSLDRLPGGGIDDNIKGLELAYEKLWAINGGEQYEELQIRLFHVVTGALENLTPQQLLEAVRFDPDNVNAYQDLSLDELEGVYSNFLRTNRQGHLEFEHISAEVFVSKKREHDLETSRFEVDSILARSCSYYLRKTDFGGRSRQTSDDKYPFLNYAAIHWISHVRQGKDEDEMLNVALTLLRAETKVLQTWLPIFWATEKTSALLDPPGTGLMVAVYLNLKTVIQTLIREEENLNAKAENGWTALHWAVQQRMPTVVKELLKRVDCTAQDVEKRTALHLAVIRMDYECVELFADQETTSCLELKDVFGLTALHLAVRWTKWCGETGEAIIELLLEMGAKPDTSDLLGQTALDEARAYEGDSVVQLLQDLQAERQTCHDRLSDRSDSKANWRILMVGISHAMNDPEPCTMQLLTYICGDYHFFSPQQNGIKDEEASSYFDKLHKYLKGYIEDHLQSLKRAVDHLQPTDNSLYTFYIRQRRLYFRSAALVRRILYNFDRHWLWREVAEGKNDTYRLEELYARRWSEFIRKDERIQKVLKDRQ